MIASDTAASDRADTIVSPRRKALLVTAAIVVTICAGSVALGKAFPSLYRGVEWICP